MKNPIVGLTITIFIFLMFSCNTTKSQVSSDELIGKFSVSCNNDLKSKNLDLIFLTENFGKLTEFEFIESGFSKCIVAADPFGTGITYGLSTDSIKWKLDKNRLILTIPGKNDMGEKTEKIKKLEISKRDNSIVLKTNNVVYVLNKK